MSIKETIFTSRSRYFLICYRQNPRIAKVTKYKILNQSQRISSFETPTSTNELMVTSSYNQKNIDKKSLPMCRSHDRRKIFSTPFGFVSEVKLAIPTAIHREHEKYKHFILDCLSGSVYSALRGHSTCQARSVWGNSE